jgi:hypothetical protein
VAVYLSGTRVDGASKVTTLVRKRKGYLIAGMFHRNFETGNMRDPV